MCFRGCLSLLESKEESTEWGWQRTSNRDSNSGRSMRIGTICRCSWGHFGSFSASYNTAQPNCLNCNCNIANIHLSLTKFYNEA